MLLLILTMFFAAHWGGNLYVTFIALTILVLFVTTGRALGVIYVMVSSRLWGLHIVHCSSHEEIMGTLRIICSMKGVLVTVNGATYYDGYKLDGRPKAGDKPGFEEWKDEYEEGGYDEEEELSRKQMTLDDEEAGQPMLRGQPAQESDKSNQQKTTTAV